MLPTITAAALSPQTVAAGGQVLIAVTIEENIWMWRTCTCACSWRNWRRIP